MSCSPSTDLKSGWLPQYGPLCAPSQPLRTVSVKMEAAKGREAVGLEEVVGRVAAAAKGAVVELAGRATVEAR